MADQQKLMPYHARIGLAIAFLVLRAPMAEAQAPCGPGYLVQSVACRADFTEYEANEIGFRIWLALPRARAGETVSSRIYVDIDAASGRKDDSREERAWLNTQRLKWGSNSTPIADNVVVWKVPSGLKDVPGSLTAHFMDRGFRLPVNEPSPPGMDLSGWWLYQLVNLGFTVPLESISGGYAVQRAEAAMGDGEHFISPVETTLAPIEIRGPFGGDLRRTVVEVASEPAEIVAESSRKLIFWPPRGMTGLQQLVVTEAGRSITGYIRLLDVKYSSADGGDLHIALDGLSGLTSPLRMLAYACVMGSGRFRTALDVLNGAPAGRFPNCLYNDLQGAGKTRRQYVITPRSVPPSGAVAVDMKVKAWNPYIKRYPENPSDLLSLGSGAPLMLDFAPLLDSHFRR